MRLTRLLTVPVLAALIALIALIALPAVSSAQMNISVRFGTRLGPEVRVFSYSSERQGEWRNNYRRWTPVTLYDVNNHYYRNQVRGSRAVLVYSYDNQYFLPPQDQGWNGADRRYNYKRQPNESDYRRASPYTRQDAVDVRLGNEIGVLGYSSDRAGDWRTNERRWTPVTLYEVNGRYYPHDGDGARQVAMYRYRDEYFLPPNDQDWAGSDKRFDRRHMPNADDRDRVHDRP